MNPTPRATVIEFFYPEGFAYDYEWTTRALGMIHYGFWGNRYDTILTYTRHTLTTGPQFIHESKITTWYVKLHDLSNLLNPHYMIFFSIVGYPEKFQSNEIPLDGEKVAELIRYRLELDEEADD